MSKKQTPKIEAEKKHMVIKSYTYKDIEVLVKINFDENRISLLEKGSQVKPKQWVFAERGIEYMESWKIIIDAMKYAVGMASSELKAELSRRALLEELDTF